MLVNALLVLACATPAPGSPTLDSIMPPTQRVHGTITLRGGGFGTFAPTVSRVVYTSVADPDLVVDGGTPYVWRDDLIQVRVPVGGRFDGASQPIPKTPLTVHVVTAGGASGVLPFQVVTAPGAALAFEQRTEIVEQHDVSTFLGDPEQNLARTKDADIGDVDGDGDPDLIDDNSHNISNGTHAVLRLNRADEGVHGFTAIEWEPLDVADKGVFATIVPPGGDYFGNSLSYDADFVDLDNDGLVDRVQAATGLESRVRVSMNDHLGIPGRFVEATAAWFPDAGDFDGPPDDIAHTDVDHDGFVDIAVAYRLTDTAAIYLNQGGVTFAPPILVRLGASGSIHDVLFVDADHDGFRDVVLCNESGSSELHVNEGGTAPAYAFHATLPVGATSGVAADLNGDGLDDLALVQSIIFAHVFLNDPDAPGTFTAIPLPGSTFGLYDLEAGDLDLDGDVDLVAPAIILGSDQADDTARVWLNEGDGTFVDATSAGASALLPGIASFQRLSADLLDFDLDGDLDLYITGADTTGVDGIGDVPNQFFENLVAPDPEPAPGDVTGDGAVDVADLVAVILAWGPCPAPPVRCPADTDGDGEVSVADLVTVLLNWSS